jgi:hypothetical protein
VGSISLLLGDVSTNANLLLNPGKACVEAVRDLSEDSSGRRGCAVLEVAVLSAGEGAELVRGRALRNRNAIAVEIGLQLTLAPVVESALLGCLGGLREVARGRGVGRAAS